MKTTTLTTVALGLAFIGAVLLPKDCKAQEGPWTKYQRQSIQSMDNRTEYVPLLATVRRDDAYTVTMVWTIHTRGENSKRLRFAVTGCDNTQGLMYIVDADGRPSPTRPLEWAKDGGAIIDGMAMRTCMVYGETLNTKGS